MGDITVQRGTVAVSNSGGTTAPGTAFGSLSSAFVMNANNRKSHGGPTLETVANREGDDMSGTLELTGPSVITVTRESGSRTESMRFAWESWEYTGNPGGANEFIVRSRNTVTLTGETNNATLDVTPTDIDKCIPFITGVRVNATGDDWDNACPIAWLSGTNTLNIARGGTNNTVIVQVVTVEFTGSNWEVYHGRQTSPADSGTITLVDSSDGVTVGGGDVTDWATAMIVAQFKKNNRNNVDDSLSDTSCTFFPGSLTTEVDWAHHSNHVDSASLAVDQDQRFVHVLRHQDMVVTRYTDTQRATGAMNVNVASAGLTDLTESSVRATRTSSGNGTAYGRGWVNYRLTSTTNVELWVHRSGNTISTRIEVIDLTGIVSAGGTTFERSAAASASTTVAAVGDVTTTFARSAQAAAASTVAALGDVTLERATASAASTTVGVTGSVATTFERATASAASTTVGATGSATRGRSAASSATTTVAALGDVTSSLERTAQAAVTSTVAALGNVTTERAATAGAATTVGVSGGLTSERAALSAASTTVATVGDTSTALQRAAASSAATTVQVAGSVGLERATAAASSTTVAALGVAGLERSAQADATSTVAVTGDVGKARSAAAAAATTVTATGSVGLERAAVALPASTVLVTGVVGFERAAVAAASTLLDITGDTSTAFERSTTAGASTTVGATGTLGFERTAQSPATSLVVVAGTTWVERSVLSPAATTVAVVGDTVRTWERAAAASAAISVSVIAEMSFGRSASVGASTLVSVVGSIDTPAYDAVFMGMNF